MLTLLLIIIFLLAFYTGYRRGLWRELVYIAGYACAVFVAYLGYPRFAQTLSLYLPFPNPALTLDLAFYPTTMLLQLNTIFYKIMAFLLIFFLGWLLVRFIGALCYRLSRSKTGFLALIKGSLGGLAHLSVVYLFCTLFLLLLSVLPLESIQTALNHSSLALWMLEKTPVLSNVLQQIFIQ